MARVGEKVQFVGAKWARTAGDLPPGVMFRHEAQVAGWTVRAELVMTRIGALQLRVDGVDVGPPLLNCTLTKGKRQYLALLRQLSRPRQMMLPI